MVYGTSDEAEKAMVGLMTMEEDVTYLNIDFQEPAELGRIVDDKIGKLLKKFATQKKPSKKMLLCLTTNA